VHKSSIVTHKSSIVTHKSSIVAPKGSLVAYKGSLVTNKSAIVVDKSPIVAHESAFVADQLSGTRSESHPVYAPPMKILVLGASQGTGACCVKSALAKGHAVTAFSRTPAKLDVTNAALTKVAGDFHDAASVRSAVAGQDAVIITVSPSSLGVIKELPDYFSRGTGYCIDAMKAQGVKRLVVLTAHGVGDSYPVASWFQRKFLIGALLKGFYRDHDLQERLTRESGLDFVIARPTRLTNGKAKGKYVRTAELVSVPSTISRADLADFMVEACESTTWVGKAVQLGG